MSLRAAIAQGVAACARRALRELLHRDALNFPGKLALAIDPQIIYERSTKLSSGSICVVGTNGKTTVTNLIADALSQSKRAICCNRSGANMASGIASALLEQGNAEWGVFECDELWLSEVLPHLRSQYVILLNLFRDQLDRSGEISIVQQRIIAALKMSPDTILIYNADDPFCQAVAQSIENRVISFGIDESMRLTQNTVSDAETCQHCSNVLEYDYRQYGQLGSYSCPHCDFKRPILDYKASKIELAKDRVTLKLEGKSLDQLLSVPLPGAYTAYNLAAAAIASTLAGCSPSEIQQAFDNFHPNNGRLEQLKIGSHDVLVNLAKNPTGMNQNLRIALHDKRPFVLGIFINDREADGHDVSWLWDADFQDLAERPDVKVFAGGIRKHDLQVRLKYAGVAGTLVEDTKELMAYAESFNTECPVYLIASYTALPNVKTQAEALAANFTLAVAKASPDAPLPKISSVDFSQKPLTIVHLFPELLNLYGDSGNVVILCQRLQWRGIPVEVRAVRDENPLQLEDADLVFIGGAPDREQRIASQAIMENATALRSYIDSYGPCLAICGGFQMLGETWLLDGEQVPGLGIGSFQTERSASSRNRLVGNIALEVPDIKHPVIGFENHAGRTFLQPDTAPFGRVISKEGHGNNDSGDYDGFTYKNLFATYLHGPLLAKNPEVADKILIKALDHWAQRTRQDLPALQPLDDTEELTANRFLASRLL